MASSTKQPAEMPRPIAPQPSSDFLNRGLGAVFQFSMVWLVLATTWQLLGPEPQNQVEHRLQLMMVGMAYIFATGLWIVGSSWSVKTKMISITVCLLITLTLAADSVRKFDGGALVMTPARIRDGRIVHDYLGLSYVKLPDWNVNLQPRITRSPNPPSKGTSKLRLGYGEAATLCQLSQVLPTEKRNRTPTLIVLEVQRDPYRDLNHFINFVRTSEEKWAAEPDTKIVRHTRLISIAGIEMVEFEFLKEAKNLTARTVWLRKGIFALNFMCITPDAADLALFDEFLHTIQLDSVSPSATSMAARN